MLHTRPGFRVVVLDDREEAAYFYNDVLAFADGKKVCFLPSSYRRTIIRMRRTMILCCSGPKCSTVWLTGKPR